MKKVSRREKEKREAIKGPGPASLDDELDSSFGDQVGKFLPPTGVFNQDRIHRGSSEQSHRGD